MLLEIPIYTYIYRKGLLWAVYSDLSDTYFLDTKVNTISYLGTCSVYVKSFFFASFLTPKKS